jgi:hypothetical protein
MPESFWTAPAERSGDGAFAMATTARSSAASREKTVSPFRSAAAKMNLSRRLEIIGILKISEFFFTTAKKSYPFALFWCYKRRLTD